MTFLNIIAKIRILKKIFYQLFKLLIFKLFFNVSTPAEKCRRFFDFFDIPTPQGVQNCQKIFGTFRQPYISYKKNWFEILAYVAFGWKSRPNEDQEWPFGLEWYQLLLMGWFHTILVQLKSWSGCNLSENGKVRKSLYKTSCAGSQNPCPLADVSKSQNVSKIVWKVV